MTTETGAPSSDGVEEAVAAFEAEDGSPSAIAGKSPRDDKQTATDDGDSEPDAEAEEVEASDDSVDEDDDDEKEPASKLGRRVQKRIDKLTRKAADAEREGGYYRTQAQRLEAALAEARREADWYKQQGGRQQQTEPTQEDYDRGQSQGLTPQQVEKIIADRADQVAAQKEFATKLTTLEGKLRSEAPDAFARISNRALTPFEPDAIEALSEATHPVQIAKALATNDELFTKFAKLPNAAARARLIARLDGSIDARVTAAKRPTAQQLKPTPKVKGVTRAPDKDPNNMSQAEYEEWSRKQGW